MKRPRLTLILIVTPLLIGSSFLLGVVASIDAYRWLATNWSNNAEPRTGETLARFDELIAQRSACLSDMSVECPPEESVSESFIAVARIWSDHARRLESLTQRANNRIVVSPALARLRSRLIRAWDLDIKMAKAAAASFSELQLYEPEQDDWQSFQQQSDAIAKTIDSYGKNCPWICF